MVTFNDFLGVFDPWHILVGKTKPEQTAYMKRQTAAVKNYRHWYYMALDKGIYTTTQMKKKDYYIEWALDEGVSTMGLGAGGGGLPGLGLEDIAPMPGVTPGQSNTARSVDEVEHVEDVAVQLQDDVEPIADMSKEDKRKARSRFKARLRRRRTLIEKRRLASILANLLHPGDPEAAVQYTGMTLRELTEAIDVAKFNPGEEKSQSPDEIKIDPDEFNEGSNSSGAATSSEALEDIESKMDQEERFYTYGGKPVLKTGKVSKVGPGQRPYASWVALRALIRSSVSDYSEPHHGSFLMFTGGRVTGRAAALASVLSELNNMPGAAQRMLDLIDSFGIDLRDIPNMSAREAQAKDWQDLKASQFNKLTQEQKRNLRVAFNKLFRNLTEERIVELRQQKANRSRTTKINELTRFLGDLSTKVTTSEMAGSLVSPDKPLITGDFLDAENQQLITAFAHLMALTGKTDNDISQTLAQLESFAADRLRDITRAAEARGEDIDDHDVQVNLQAEIYAEFVNKILLHIQTMENTLNDRFIKGSSLRTNLNLHKLKRTIKQLIDEVKHGASLAAEFIKKPTRVNMQRRLMDIQRFYDGIRLPDAPVENKVSEWDEEKHAAGAALNLEVTNEDMSIARQMLEETPGVDRVTLTVLGRDISLGTTAVVIHWYQLPVATVRTILTDYVDTPFRRPITPGGLELHRQLLNQIQSANQEELFRLADTTIKDKEHRRRILSAFPAAKPPNQPEDPDDPPGSGIEIVYNGRRMLLKMSALVALLILLGVGTAKIVSLINNGGTVKSKDQPKAGGGDNNSPDKDNVPIITPGNPRIPTFPGTMPLPPQQFGGIGDRGPSSSPFKPIKQPIVDSKLGADYIEPDQSLLSNTAVMKLVQRYNSDATKYNELLELQMDLTDTGESLNADELKDLEQLKSSMGSTVVAINQQSQSQLIDNNYYPTSSIKPSSLSNPPIWTDDNKTIGLVYPLLPTSNYTSSVGIDDEIAEYNHLAEEYNALAAKWKGYGPSVPQTMRTAFGNQGAANRAFLTPEYTAAVDRATVLEGKLNALLAKINAVQQAPESGIGRQYARTVRYNPLQKSFIKKIVDNQFDSLTPEEKKAMRDSPELYASYEKLMTWYAKSKTVPYAQRDFKTYDALIKEFIATSERDYTPSNFKAGSGVDWTDVQAKSQHEYVRAKQDFLAAVAALKQAKLSGVNPHQLSGLYNDLETKRLHYERTRTSYETMADNYKHALSGRTSFLADITLERLPDGADETARFDRLQEVERVLQHNPDALKAYNDGVAGMGESTNSQNYSDRMDLIKSISGMYNLSNEYTDAVNRNIHVQVQDAGEDPSTVVEFKSGGEDVGKSTERANFIDPAERELFMTDARDRALEQKRWMDFSSVQPWNGLGTPRENPLLDHQVQEYMTRYGNTTKGPQPTPWDMRNLPSNRGRMIQAREQQPNYQADIAFIPTIQASYGREMWEDEGAIPTTNFQSQEAMFTRDDNNLPNNRWGTFNPPQGSTYHPDLMIDRHRGNEAVGPMLKQNSNRRSVYYGVTPAFNEQYGSQQTSTFGGATMNNNYSNTSPQPVQRPQQKPNSIYDTLDPSARRGMSRRR